MLYAIKNDLGHWYSLGLDAWVRELVELDTFKSFSAALRHRVGCRIVPVYRHFLFGMLEIETCQLQYVVKFDGYYYGRGSSLYPFLCDAKRYNNVPSEFPLDRVVTICELGGVALEVRNDEVWIFDHLSKLGKNRC